MKKLFDLRFVIGIFFAIVGLILICVGAGSEQIMESGFSSRTINLSTGSCMAGFGVCMILASLIWKEGPEE